MTEIKDLDRKRAIRAALEIIAAEYNSPRWNNAEWRDRVLSGIGVPFGFSGGLWVHSTYETIRERALLVIDETLGGNGL